MKAVFFGTFHSTHAANALLKGDLERAGWEVELCHEPLWERTRDKHDAYFAPFALVRLAGAWLAAARRLRRRYRARAGEADLLVAGFNGQLDVLLARLVSPRGRILFAPLVSVSETLVDDRRIYRPGSLAARVLASLDRLCLGRADLVVIDTRAHASYLTERFGLPRGRIAVQYLGAEEVFAPGEKAPAGAAGEHGGAGAGGALRVLCYSSYLPLHGMRVVAEAARRLGPGEGIELSLVGDGPEREACDRLVRGLPHVGTCGWLSIEELVERIRRADVVLGIFGSSAKARMVIPNKVYQAAQVGRAIVTADTPAIREVFRPGESLLAIEPEATALAAALRRLARDPALVARLGTEARRAVESAAGREVRARRLAEALGRLERRRPREGAG